MMPKKKSKRMTDAPDLPDRARHILARPGLGRAIHITQHNDLRFTRLVIYEASLALVRSGSLRVQSAGGEWTLRAGQALAVAGGLTVSMTYLPGESGLYQGEWLTWQDEFIASRQREGQAAPPPFLTEARLLPLPAGLAGEAFSRAFERACVAMDPETDLPLPIVAHRAAEVLLWLEQEGIYFDPRGSRSLSRRLRLLLRAAPGKDWSEAGLGRQLGMSPATLRRYLAAEGASFRSLLAEVRMQSALNLLQSTALSIGQVALEVGYESQSRFAARFRERFGFPPSVVRGHKRD